MNFLSSFFTAIVTMSNEQVALNASEPEDQLSYRKSGASQPHIDASPRNGKFGTSSASNSGEESFLRSNSHHHNPPHHSNNNKSTQIDFPISGWRYGGQGVNYSRATRPTSVGHLSKLNQFNGSNVSIYTPTRNTLYSSRSEVILSPRNRQPSRFVALDILKSSVPNAQCAPFSASNYSTNNPNCNCCCNCNGMQNNQMPSSHQQQHEDPDGPEGLSWRRLHMSRAKLKATATTSELLSGFAMVAMVELQVNEPTAVPEWLFVTFAVCTTVLVSVHIFALMISTYLLPNVEAISKLQISSLVTESPHERMRGFIELAWAFSTVLGLFLFLVEVAILCWVKFWDYSFMAATASTIIVIPVLIVFVAFAVHFYHSLVVYKCEASSTDMAELEKIKRKLDNAHSAQTTV
ncbi:uncharacterized protein [Venturia canescens]|uniref:uncharacterized protein n=1 Tax=Venturia canescens TaxID=32260 RepID=UPI001C9D3622|nr:uncharacterized protein LOC122405761 [Venturia canescens]